MTNGLGRGLGSLIPNAADDKKNEQLAPLPPATRADLKQQSLEVPIELIKVNPHQPRQQFADTKLDELVDSIKEHGIIQPLIVTQSGDGYELIAGERRLRAAKKAGLELVPVVVRQAGEQEKLEMAVIENIQRENLNPVELGHAYRQLLEEFNLTQDEVAKRLGKPRSSVTNTMRMLNLPEEIQLALMDGRIGEGHAKYLLGLDSEAKQMKLFRKIVHNNLTVRNTNEEARRMGGTKRKQVKINYEDKDKEFKLREFFGTKVELKRKRKGGQIVVDFFSEEELKNILDKIS